MPLSVDQCKLDLYDFRKSAVGITNMILAAARYPDAQRRVQEELDMVVGNDRSEPLTLAKVMYV